MARAGAATAGSDPKPATVAAVAGTQACSQCRGRSHENAAPAMASFACDDLLDSQLQEQTCAAGDHVDLSNSEDGAPKGTPVNKKADAAEEEFFPLHRQHRYAPLQP